MSRNFGAIFCLVLAALVICSESGKIPAKNNLTFLGKFTKISKRMGSEHGTQQTSFYFLSQNAAAWSSAGSDCKANLGDTSSLANIETDEELEELNDLIRNSDNTGSKYWLGGKYDPESKTFVWDNGVEIISSIPWDQGHPTHKTQLTKVLASTVGEVRLQTDFQTASLRYVCELPV